jgi:hypothetical protein
MKLGVRGSSIICEAYVFAPFIPGEIYRDYLLYRLKEYYKKVNEYGYCPFLLWKSMNLDEEFCRYNKDKDFKEKNDPHFLMGRSER